VKNPSPSKKEETTNQGGSQGEREGIKYSNSLLSSCLPNLGEGWLSKLAPPSDLCNKSHPLSLQVKWAGLQQVEGINSVLNSFNECSYLLAACCLLSLTKVLLL